MTDRTNSERVAARLEYIFDSEDHREGVVGDDPPTVRVYQDWAGEVSLKDLYDYAHAVGSDDVSWDEVYVSDHGSIWWDRPATGQEMVPWRMAREAADERRRQDHASMFRRLRELYGDDPSKWPGADAK